MYNNHDDDEVTRTKKIAWERFKRTRYYYAYLVYKGERILEIGDETAEVELAPDVFPDEVTLKLKMSPIPFHAPQIRVNGKKIELKPASEYFYNKCIGLGMEIQLQ